MGSHGALSGCPPTQAFLTSKSKRGARVGLSVLKPYVQPCYREAETSRCPQWEPCPLVPLPHVWEHITGEERGERGTMHLHPQNPQAGFPDMLFPASVWAQKASGQVPSGLSRMEPGVSLLELTPRTRPEREWPQHPRTARSWAFIPFPPPSPCPKGL